MAEFFDDALDIGHTAPANNMDAGARRAYLAARTELGIRLAIAANDAVHEAFLAASKWPPMNSAHEAFGVLAEEVDELAEASGLEPVILAMSKLWGHVKVNQKRRDPVAMRAEAIQVAAMALRFVVDVIDGGRVRK